MDWTLDQLRALDAIDRTGSFAGAAGELHRVPSAVSYLIRGLEDALGVPIFDRSGRRARLTPSGQMVLFRAREVLAAAGQLERATAELRDGWEPEVRVVVDGALPMAPVTAALSAFRDAGVPTRVRLDVEYQEGVPERFVLDDADIMLIIDHDEREEGHEVTAMAPLEMVLVAGPTHALAQTSVTDTGGGLEVVVRDSSSQFRRKPRETWLGNPNTIYLSDFHSKRLTLRSGIGYGWMPRHLVQGDLADGSLVPVQLQTGHTWTYQPRLVRRRRPGPGRAADLFVKTVLTPTSRG